MNADLNPFLLCDPPPGAETFFRNSILPGIEFDWERMRPYFNSLPEKRVLVKWESLDGGAAARWMDYEHTVLIDPLHWDLSMLSQYRVTHELGHMVDFRHLNNQKRASLIKLFLADPSHRGIHEECWKGKYEIPYYERIHEGWADEFVYVYAPSVPYRGNYTHFISDRAAVKTVMDRSDHMTSEQWAGGSRYETAQIVSMNRYPQMPTPVIVYIGADGTPDAQSAAAAAGGLLDLVPGTFLLHPNAQATAQSNTLAEITRLKPVKIIYVGGTTPIPVSARTAYDAAGQPVEG